MALIRFLIALAGAFGIALACYPALQAPDRRRFRILLVAQLLILICPLLVPEPARFLRQLAAIAAITFTVKLFDLHVGACTGHRPTLYRLGVFLWNPFCLVDRRMKSHPDRFDAFVVSRLLWSVAATIAAAMLAVQVFRIDWTSYPFALEHVSKVVSFFLFLVPFTAVAEVGWRALIGPARDHMRNPFAARTPADFWRRYNRPVHEFFAADFFTPNASGTGRRGGGWPAAAAILLAFLVSAGVHEYVFAVPIGRVQGYQTAFFLIQGLAVAATARVKPRGWRVIPWVAATFAFNIVTGLLFFASLNHVVPMYQHRPPLWDE
jgi:hypothetical protein